MIVEDVDRRAFAAIRFVHGVTGAPIGRTLAFDGPGLLTVRNRSGLLVVREAIGLSPHTSTFPDPPALVEARRRDFACSVRDPQGQFLRQGFTLRLPRPTRGIDAEPLAEGDLAATPIKVVLLPAAALPLSPAWAALRLAVHIAGTTPSRGLANAWVEGTPRLPGKALVRGLTDAAGEALLVVPDIGPVVAGDPAEPLATSFVLDLVLVLDPLLVRPAPRDADEARALPLADVQQADSRRAASTVVAAGTARLRAGQSSRQVVTVAWP